MSTPEMTPAEKQKAFRAGQHAKGLKCKQLWIPENRIKEVESYIAQLNAEHTGDEVVESPDEERIYSPEYYKHRNSMIKRATTLIDLTLEGALSIGEVGDFAEVETTPSKDAKSLFTEEEEEVEVEDEYEEEEEDEFI